MGRLPSRLESVGHDRAPARRDWEEPSVTHRAAARERSRIGPSGTGAERDPVRAFLVRAAVPEAALAASGPRRRRGVNVLVVYGSQFGNTERIARTIGAALERSHSVQVVGARDGRALAGVP